MTGLKSADQRIGDFTFDGVGHRESAIYDDGYAAYFGYDASGNMLYARELTEGPVYYAYDALSRMTEQKFAVGGAAYYTYDAVSNRRQLTYPSGGTAYYAYDPAGRMTSAKAPSGNSASYEYDAAGDRTKSVWGNGSYSYYTYDAAGRTESIRHFTGGGAALAYFDYSRDARGDITKIARLDGLTTYYDYDAVGRLTYEDWKEAGGTSVYAFTYDYDQNGNRTSGLILGVATYWEYNEADALVTKWTEPGPSEAAYYSYDADGNLTTLIDEPSGSITYFEHGSHGLVTGIKPLGGTEVTFAYDGLLRRIRMSEGATHTYFRHDGINFLEIANSDGTLTKVTHGYARVPGIGSALEVEINGVRYYFVQDDRGTLHKIIDSAGNVIWSGLCDAFGVRLAETGTNPTIFWYQGQAWIRIIINSHDIYVSATRTYAPEHGRFLERDPAGILTSRPPIGISFYVYCGSSPLCRVDPTGRVIITIVVFIGAVVAGVAAVMMGASTIEGIVAAVIVLILGLLMDAAAKRAVKQARQTFYTNKLPKAVAAKLIEQDKLEPGTNDNIAMSDLGFTKDGLEAFKFVTKAEVEEEDLPEGFELTAEPNIEWRLAYRRRGVDVCDIEYIVYAVITVSGTMDGEPAERTQYWYEQDEESPNGWRRYRGSE